MPLLSYNSRLANTLQMYLSQRHFPSAIIMPLEEVAQEGSVFESASRLQLDSDASDAVATLALSCRADCPLGRAEVVVEVSLTFCLSWVGRSEFSRH